ncbi:hypothetical protein RRG08_006994 [Elysia crispata]|uniref:Uncharacterized protein n=1 Tax=Elysia crispata TaxID=231223 RepID=A0AAE1A5C3_9GAST|nr:hypothetical protein RRG08_006994 [Elysia crispata]
MTRPRHTLTLANSLGRDSRVPVTQAELSTAVSHESIRNNSRHEWDFVPCLVTVTTAASGGPYLPTFTALADAEAVREERPLDLSRSVQAITFERERNHGEVLGQRDPLLASSGFERLEWDTKLKENGKHRVPVFANCRVPSVP